MFMLIVLIVVMAAWGSVIVVYASSSHTALVQTTPTPAPTQPAQQTIADTPATIEPQVKDSVISEGNSNLPEVALTFDDGPSAAYTPQILSILQQNGVHATFFCVGEQVQYYPDLVQQEYSTGNVVANHSWSHPDLTTLTSLNVQTQLSRTSAIIQQATGVQPTLFRPPYGAIDQDVKSQVAEQGLTPVLWSIDTEDWQRPASDAIVKNALDEAENGAIILLHDGGGDRSQTIAALPTIIKNLQEHGFQLVTVQQLINDVRYPRLKDGSFQKGTR
jgi:peptidoglycan-N-acetylglucosamine deacetylase